MTHTKFSAGLVATLIGLSTLPAAADRMVIDDDRWFMTEDRPTGPTIEIDDDYWRMVETRVSVSRRDDSGLTGDCTSLETSAGLSGIDCGTLSQADVIRLLGEND